MGYFDITTNSCLRSRFRRNILTLISDYNTCKAGNTTPYCIGQYYNDLSVDEGFFYLMKSELVTWTVKDVAINGNAGVYITRCQFEPAAIAILQLLSLKSFYTDEIVVNSLVLEFLGLTESALVPTADYSLCTDGLNIVEELVKLYEQCLEVFHNVAVGMSPAYIAVVNLVNAQLNQIAVNIVQTGVLGLNSLTEIASASNPPMIVFELFIQVGDYNNFGCTCS